MVKLSKLNDAISGVKDQKSDLRKSSSKEKTTKEKRSVKMGSYVKPSEKEAFLKLIGRKTESDAIRELILEAIKKGKSI